MLSHRGIQFLFMTNSTRLEAMAKTDPVNPTFTDHCKKDRVLTPQLGDSARQRKCWAQTTDKSTEIY